MLPHAVFADALIQGHDLPSARHLPRPAPFRMWLRPLIVVDDPRVDAERAGRSMMTKPCVAGSIPAGGTEFRSATISSGTETQSSRRYGVFVDESAEDRAAHN